MEIVLKTFFYLLVGGFAFTASQEEGSPGGEQSFPEYPSTVYNPVNSVKYNVCGNKSEDYSKRKAQVTEIKEAFDHLVNELQHGDFCSYVQPTPTPTSPRVATDCYDIQQNGETTSGVYTITPENSPSFEVYCDMDTDGGGWTVFQRRVDDSTDFYLYWEDYKVGFGSLSGNFWLGNEHLHYLTTQRTYILRVDLEDFEYNTRYAVYNFVRVLDESTKYRLSLGFYTGDAGNAMAYCNGYRFSTRDDENGNNCPDRYKGGWWYSNCHYANLNGLYLGGRHDSFADGIEWEQWKGYYYSLKFTEMKVRPTNRF